MFNVLKVSSRVAKTSISRAAVQPSRHVRQYHERVIDHYEKPRNVGSLNKKDSDVGTGLV